MIVQPVVEPMELYTALVPAAGQLPQLGSPVRLVLGEGSADELEDDGDVALLVVVFPHLRVVAARDHSSEVTQHVSIVLMEDPLQCLPPPLHLRPGEGFVQTVEGREALLPLVAEHPVVYQRVGVEEPDQVLVEAPHDGAPEDDDGLVLEKVRNIAREEYISHGEPVNLSQLR